MPVWHTAGLACSVWVLFAQALVLTTAHRCAVSMADHRPSWLDVGTRIEVQWDIVTDEDEQPFVECVPLSHSISPNRSVVDDVLGQHRTRSTRLSVCPVGTLRKQLNGRGGVGCGGALPLCACAKMETIDELPLHTTSHFAKKICCTFVTLFCCSHTYVGAATFARAPTNPPCAVRLTASQVLQPDMSRTWRM
jgi:hypothetical protein